MKIYVITCTDIYIKSDNSVTFKFMFECGIDFDKIIEYSNKYGFIIFRYYHCLTF